jgi:HD domain
MKIPSLPEAEELLQEAHSLNPGPWEAHSRYVAQAAQVIAEHLIDLDPHAAYILGCLHDIGRRFGVTGMRHVIDGYRFLLSKGFDDAARISLTHSYPIKNVASGSAKWDGTAEEYQFVQTYLDEIEYDPYDRLIQLCDSLALPSGFCLLEKRFVDVALRYGYNPMATQKWKAYIQIKEDFERQIGKSVYCLLPGVIENTFAN